MISQNQGSKNNLPNIVLELLRSLPKQLSDALQAAALLHWFDASLLSPVMSISVDTANRLYEILKGFSIVQRWQGTRSAVHELARNIVLNELWQNNPSLAIEWSTRAANVFSDRYEESLDPEDRIEFIYHLLISNPDRGADELRSTGSEFVNKLQYHLLRALVNRAMEHEIAGRLLGRARGWTLYRKGSLDLSVGRYPDAKVALSQALSESHEDKKLKANCERRLADVELAQANFSLAQVLYKNALDLYQDLGDKTGRARCLEGLADLFMRQAKYDQASLLYKDALQIYEEIESRIGKANCLRGIGDTYYMQTEYHDGQAYYLEALGIYEQLGENFGIANSLKDVGDVSLKLQNYIEAREYYNRAIEIYDSLEHAIGTAGCMMGLGDIHLELSEYPQAKLRYQTALTVFADRGDQLDVANCIRSIGDVCLEMGNEEEALESYANAEKIFRELNLPDNVASVLSAQAGILDSKGQYEESFPLYDQAVKLSPLNPIWFRNRASANIKLKRYGDAEVDLKIAASMQPNHPYLQLRFGDLALAQNEFETALTNYALYVSSNPQVNYGYFCLALTHSGMNHSLEALTYMQEALDRTYQASDAEIMLRELMDFGRLFDKSSEEIITSLREVLERWIHQRKFDGIGL